MKANIAKADNWMPMIVGASPQMRDIDALWDTTRGTPFEVPREAFRIALRADQDAEVMLDLVNRLPAEDLIPRRWAQPGYQKMSGNYLYVVTYSGYDTETHKIDDRSLGFVRDQALTLQEIQDTADDLFGKGTYGLEIEGLESEITSVYHKVGAEW